MYPEEEESMHNTHENTLGKASAKKHTICIIIQGGYT